MYTREYLLQGREDNLSREKAMRITQRPLFYWVLHRNRALQLFLLLIILISLVFRVIPLEMQKRIVNQAIQLKDLHLLFLYCGLYFGAVILAGISKYTINVLQMVIGQKILIELRTTLYHHVLQLPLQYYRGMQPGTVMSAMTAELNAIGYFLGGALAIPLTSLLTFLIFLGYMFMLNSRLALITMGLYAVELVVIPILQKRYNRLNRKRITTVRAMANVVNEAISGIHEIHANSSFVLEEQRLRTYILELYTLLKRLFIVKYGIKFSNNLFQSFGPFLLFLLGGYYAVMGDFTLGALVAFLSAHEKVYDPWKEIIEYYQSFQDARVRYSQIMEIFDLEPEYPLLPEGRKPVQFSGKIELQNASFTVGGRINLLNRISTSIRRGEQIAIVGFSGSGKSTLLLCMDQLYPLSAGTISYDGHNIETLSKADINNNITLISQKPFVFAGTIRDNLLYGVQSRALLDDEPLPDLSTQLRAIYDTGLEEDIIRFGFQTVLTRECCAPFKEKLLTIRHELANQLQREFSDVVEFYNIDKFLQYVSLRDNLIFGDCPTGKFDSVNLPENRPFMQLLKQTGLAEPFLHLGLTLAKETVQLLYECRNDEFFFRYTPMQQTEFKEYVELIDRNNDALPESRKGQAMLYRLALRFIPGFHRVAVMDPSIEGRVVEARKLFLQNVVHLKMSSCTGKDSNAFCFLCEKIDNSSPFQPFCPNQYLYSRTLLENILFGEMKSRKSMGEELSNLLYAMLAKDMLDDVLDVGLNFQVGSQGDRLSGGQKQKLAIARALLRNTPIILLDEATASLDNISQRRIQDVLDTRQQEGKTIVSVIHRLENAPRYDRILLLKNGLLVEEGTFSQLLSRKGLFFELVKGSQQLEENERGTRI